MAKVELPSGEWAMLVDVDSITSGQRKELLRASKDLDDAFDVNDAMVSRLVLSWSFEMPAPTPADASSLDDVPYAAADALTKACIAIVHQLTPNFDPTPDPASPTSPSAA